MTSRLDRRVLGAAIIALASLGAASMPALAQDDDKLIAIANFGPHVTLDQAIEGFKKALADKGFVEARTSNTNMPTATSTRRWCRRSCAAWKRGTQT
ncbi:MAG: hypothetical protein ACE368_24190 [Paracoccaceae bacterium]